MNESVGRINWLGREVQIPLPVAPFTLRLRPWRPHCVLKTSKNAAGMWWMRGKKTVKVHSTSFLSYHCVYHVSTNFLPWAWSCAHRVQCILNAFSPRPFRSHYALITHIRRPHCVLLDLRNTTSRACQRFLKLCPRRLHRGPGRTQWQRSENKKPNIPVRTLLVVRQWSPY